MTLIQLATAAGVAPKWVKNAEQVLGFGWDRTPEAAWRLALVREMNIELGLPLTLAVRIARAATRSGIDQGEMVYPGSHEATVGIAVDLRRSRSNFLARLSRALILDVPKRRGRPPRRGPHRLETAAAHGVDISLLRSSLELPVGERLERLDANASFLRSIKREVGGRTKF